MYILKIIPLKTAKRIKAMLLKGVPEKSEKSADVPLFGVNLFGFFGESLGLGQGARLLADALAAAGIPHKKVDVALKFGEKGYYDAPYDVNLFHINPDRMETLFYELDEGVFRGRKNIGFWLWELTEIPESWAKWADFFDEIWVPSEFIKAAVEKSVKKPVKCVRYGVTADGGENCDRKSFSLPENDFLFLAMFDSNSTAERKNPYGALEAFKSAFVGQSGVSLVLKVMNADEKALGELRRRIGDDKNVLLITEKMSKERVNALIRLCGCFVSLHRAEGFGLVIAEAMLLGKPVIATFYSAPAEFMTRENSCPVGYELVEIKSPSPPYLRGFWAEPDIAEAADCMKRIFEDRAFREETGRRALADAKTLFSVEKCGERIWDCLDGLR